MRQKPTLLAISLLSILWFSACKKADTYSEPELVLKATPAAPVSGGWRKMGDFLNSKCTPTYLFTLGDKAYFAVTGTEKTKSTFWQYDPAGNQFTAKADLPGTGQIVNGENYIYRIHVNMAINGKGYVALQWTSAYDNSYTEKKKQMWEYDPTADRWNQKADLFVDTFNKAGTFTIGNTGYACSWDLPAGYRNAETYSYDPLMDKWSHKNISFPGANTGGTSQVAFVVNDKGYMINWGRNYDSLETSEYNPSTNNWQTAAGFPIHPSVYRSVISYAYYTLNGKAYIYAGNIDYDTNIPDNRIFEYSPATHQWAQMPDFPGQPRKLSMAFTVGNKAYIAFGFNTDNYCDIWEYNP